MEKPPLGLKPEYVCRAERLADIISAIIRFYDAKVAIPLEWIDEYNRLVKAENLTKNR